MIFVEKIDKNNELFEDIKHIDENNMEFGMVENLW